MDDSPRSAKRRKLDASKPTESAALRKPSTRKPTGKLAKPSISNLEDNKTPKPVKKPVRVAKGRALKSATNGTAAKPATAKNVDVYDDFEGAFDIEVPSKANRQPPQEAPQVDVASAAHVADEPQPAAAPKRRRGRPTNAEVAARKAANGDAINVIPLATRPVAAKPSAKTARKPAAPRAKAPRKKKEPSPIPEEEEEEGEEDELQDFSKATAPPKPPAARKAATSIRKRVVPKTSGADGITAPATAPRRHKPTTKETSTAASEDDLADASPTRNKRLPASTTRRLSHTDHITNIGEERWSDVEGQANTHNDDDDLDVDGNSALGSVLDPTEPSPFNKPTSAQKKSSALPLIYSNLAPGHELDLIKTIVMERITGKRPSSLVGLDEEYKSVHQVVEHTITAGEGNSMLIIGARGSGKTALVNKVLSEVSKDNGGHYHVVRLNGFVHTDDKIALREIWRQLGKEMDIEEDGSGPGKNYADTLATLLALLSHPSEQTGEDTDQVAKAVIFIMDEFDLFAHHPRQTLLYNLFDIAQSRKAPIAVLGLTTRIDVTNTLEKRVKSRFSHRYVHLKLATSFTAFQTMCKACLTLEPEQLSVKERGILGGGAKSTPSKGQKGDAKQDMVSEWNANISKLFATPSFLTQHLAPSFYLTKSVPQVLTSFLLPTATLSPDTPFQPGYLLSAPDSKLCLVPSLSTLALSLLIAAARLDIIHDSDTCNFNMAYDEYVSLASRARIQSAAGGLSSSSGASKVWCKDVARREWEGLVELGLCMPVVQGQVGSFGMVRCDVALEEVGEVLKGIRGGDKGLERWCRSI
ncbi:hypothetical protein COCC4DRAFT_83197 [Bipolaris maydis ATCC 48331]|uniref:Origin recognition complex subunit 4 n=2 Tax=Cochliobolus heterostrophus TaxID=5016 RepID=M2UJX3_COCH5|nr:uncharacterized protein COCC4DRAFT_83197 [Bipolaris maydis ATCC 48331]EMD88288.1 hypothetical protein COCHEDRAFT_1227470 [Bipolaris maydis C5]KAJ5024522.1 origin recognition complex subunit 4 C-terminus-domain-containing protein [Bipolaris maydis]ENI02141.1 hypothetical protein COCC4DRAFT_83197 [Bipolaris maydis ATCC 48331]KAJ6207249.1 origin recognition complex subunit 4 C-terminus-domain-containing protein [Bipolaris maydis]KAJ6268250.1 origin recognition complex subunit 4 C-terminus-doma